MNQSRDLSQAVSKISLLKAVQILKMTTIFTNDDFFSNLTILNEKSYFAHPVTIIFVSAWNKSRD